MSASEYYEQELEKITMSESKDKKVFSYCETHFNCAEGRGSMKGAKEIFNRFKSKSSNVKTVTEISNAFFEAESELRKMDNMPQTLNEFLDEIESFNNEIFTSVARHIPNDEILPAIKSFNPRKKLLTAVKIIREMSAFISYCPDPPLNKDYLNHCIDEILSGEKD